jgi:hypothetical protein
MEEYLISPAGVESWIDWSQESEAIHGIPRSLLLDSGKQPSWVCHRMSQQLAGKIAYSDNPDYDSMWLSKLYAGSSSGRAPFYLRDIDELLLGILMPELNYDQAYSKIAGAKEMARNIVANRHRAADDVGYLIEIYSQVVNCK